jgi:hypothetical protein
MYKKRTIDPADLVDIVHVCDNHYCKENGKEIIVHPWYFSENGTPICSECGNDLAYARTEIRKD